jgi:hypothetical protein
MSKATFIGSFQHIQLLVKQHFLVHFNISNYELKQQFLGSFCNISSQNTFNWQLIDKEFKRIRLYIKVLRYLY